MQTETEKLRQQLKALKERHQAELAKLGRRIKDLERYLGLGRPDEPAVVLRAYELERLDLPFSWEQHGAKNGPRTHFGGSR